MTTDVKTSAIDITNHVATHGFCAQTLQWVEDQLTALLAGKDVVHEPPPSLETGVETPEVPESPAQGAKGAPGRKPRGPNRT